MRSHWRWCLVMLMASLGATSGCSTSKPRPVIYLPEGDRPTVVADGTTAEVTGPAVCLKTGTYFRLFHSCLDATTDPDGH